MPGCVANVKESQGAKAALAWQLHDVSSAAEMHADFEVPETASV
jgi:hypothetical protein